MADSVKTDEEIVHEVLDGNTEAFREIVERYQNLVYGIGIRFFRNADDAGDFAQETFVKAFRYLESFKQRAPFRFWLARLAYNAACSRVSSRREESDLFEDEMVKVSDTQSRDYERSEIRTLLVDAINQLPEEYRLCVDLFFFGGFSQREISRITGISAGTIKSNVYRAKRMLYDCLKGTIAEDYHEM